MRFDWRLRLSLPAMYLFAGAHPALAQGQVLSQRGCIVFFETSAFFDLGQTIYAVPVEEGSRQKPVAMKIVGFDYPRGKAQLQNASCPNVRERKISPTPQVEGPASPELDDETLDEVGEARSDAGNAGAAGSDTGNLGAAPAPSTSAPPPEYRGRWRQIFGAGVAGGFNSWKGSFDQKIEGFERFDVRGGFASAWLRYGFRRARDFGIGVDAVFERSFSSWAAEDLREAAALPLDTVLGRGFFYVPAPDFHDFRFYFFGYYGSLMAGSVDVTVGDDKDTPKSKVKVSFASGVRYGGSIALLGDLSKSSRFGVGGGAFQGEYVMQATADGEGQKAQNLKAKFVGYDLFAMLGFDF